MKSSREPRNVMLFTLRHFIYVIEILYRFNHYKKFLLAAFLDKYFQKLNFCRIIDQIFSHLKKYVQKYRNQIFFRSGLSLRDLYLEFLAVATIKKILVLINVGT